MRGRFEDLLEHHFGDQVLKDVEFRGAITWVPHVTVGPVITTNFDRLLEKVFDNAGCPFPIRVWHERVEAAIKSFSQNGLALLKLRGDWQFPSERVLTLSEYRRHYGDPNSDIDFQLPIPHLLELLVTRPVLFLRMQPQAGPDRESHHAASGPDRPVPPFRDPRPSGHRGRVFQADRRINGDECPADLVSAEAIRQNRRDSRLAGRTGAGVAAPGQAQASAGDDPLVHKSFHRTRARAKGAAGPHTETPPRHGGGRSRGGQDCA